MKLLLDFLPIILFFLTFNAAEKRAEEAAGLATDWFGFMVSGGVVGPKEAPVLLATVVVILATLAQVIYLKMRRQKVDTMLWVSLGLVTVLGGATIWFHSEAFIKWKPTVLYWVMSAAFWLSPILAGKNLLKLLLGEQVELPEFAWKRLNLAWVGFFAFMGALNLWVAFNFETSTWVNFKLFGGMGLMFVFMLAQGFYLSKHLKGSEE
ncbi:MAG: septation protein A [Burkholderiales bacterium]|jgi:intracellular septation protein|nr:septation protein A [Burkholderiales bacterium]MBP6250911.1 septation protein A [Leptothrix sp. (in: b-proteobacteria)]MBP7519202.1 septation protein A [Leptothrix sp. (in: b-proteobacteria)]HQY08091.1 septation protein A [Burkholderiaceae bacterium]